MPVIEKYVGAYSVPRHDTTLFEHVGKVTQEDRYELAKQIMLLLDFDYLQRYIRGKTNRMFLKG